MWWLLQESGILSEEQKKQHSEKTIKELESQFVLPSDKLKVCTIDILIPRDDNHYTPCRILNINLFLYLMSSMSSLSWPAHIQIIRTKGSVCIRKELNSHKIGLVHVRQHNHLFIVFKHHYGCRIVMWKCSTDYSIPNQDSSSKYSDTYRN